MTTTDLAVPQHEAAAALAALGEAGAFSPVGLTLPVDISPDRYEAVGRALGSMKESVQWAIGDWLAFGEKRWGEESFQLHEALGISPESRMQYIRVASRVEPHRRQASLSWSHHRLVVAFEPQLQEHFLQLAVNENLSKRELEEAIRAAKDKQGGGDGGGSGGGSKSYVVEQVADAAEHVFEKAVVDSGGMFRVPYEPMLELARALGKELPE